MKKMTDRNPYTGEKLQSRVPSTDYRSNYDRIFKKNCANCGVPYKHWESCELSSCPNRTAKEPIKGA